MSDRQLSSPTPGHQWTSPLPADCINVTDSRVGMYDATSDYHAASPSLADISTPSANTVFSVAETPSSSSKHENAPNSPPTSISNSVLTDLPRRSRPRLAAASLNTLTRQLTVATASQPLTPRNLDPVLRQLPFDPLFDAPPNPRSCCVDTHITHTCGHITVAKTLRCTASLNRAIDHDPIELTKQGVQLCASCSARRLISQHTEPLRTAERWSREKLEEWEREKQRALGNFQALHVGVQLFEITRLEGEAGEEEIVIELTHNGESMVLS